MFQYHRPFTADEARELNRERLRTQKERQLQEIHADIGPLIDEIDPSIRETARQGGTELVLDNTTMLILSASQETVEMPGTDGLFVRHIDLLDEIGPDMARLYRDDPAWDEHVTAIHSLLRTLILDYLEKTQAYYTLLGYVCRYSIKERSDTLTSRLYLGW